MDNEEKKENSPPENKSGGNGTADEISELKEKIELLGRERDEYLNGWRRAKADFLNYKNEEMARLEETVKFGSADVIKELIPVINSLELAVKAGEKEKLDVSGMAVIKSQLESILKRRGLRPMEVAIGKQFDPALHEVINMSDSSEPEGVILEVLEPGYLLYDKVLYPAKVAVSNGKLK